MKRPWALPLVPLYWLGATAKNYLYDYRKRPVRTLTRPVVSVGSLSAGGAGKTPVVLALAELLGRQGYPVDVLSRGYGRSADRSADRDAGQGSGTVEQVEPAGPAARFGDEPLELAQAGLDVFVGADRFAAGQLAERTLPASTRLLHLLDDGFQHRRLGRSCDVVLVTLDDLHDRLLPAGNLREPLRSLRRADAVVAREEEAEAVFRLTSHLTRGKFWVIRRELVLPAVLPATPVAFCALARPEGFFSLLPHTVSAKIAFRDHHPYASSDVQSLLDTAAKAQANGFLTTRKDFVKLTPPLLARLAEVGPVAVAQLRVSFLDEARVMQELVQFLPPA